MRAPARSHPGETRKAGRPLTLTEAERRQRILAAAEDLFLGQGYAATSMDDVAHACGMSKKTLYRLFAHKQSLFAALVGAVLDQLPAAVVSPLPPGVDGATALRRVLDALVHLLLHPRRLALARLVASEATQAPELVETLIEGGIRRAEGLLLGVLLDLHRAGRLSVEPDLILVRVLLGAVTSDLAIRGMLGALPPEAGVLATARIDRLLILLGPILLGPGPATPSQTRLGAPALHDPRS